MNATPSVAAPSVPAPASSAGASGANAAPADASAVGEFAAMLEALSMALPTGPTPTSGPAAEIESDAVAGEEAGASEATGESGIAALASGWPWLGLQVAAPAEPASGTTGTSGASATDAAPVEGLTGRVSAPNVAGSTQTALQPAGAPDFAPRGKASPAQAADAQLPLAFAPTAETARADKPAPLTDAASALAPAGAAISPSLSPATHAAPVHQAALPSRPGEPAFATDLAAEVRVMVEGGLQEAELSLHPAELGPIQVQLRVNGGSADISLVAANGFTRDGLAQALPELREMLASQGLQLGQAGVDAGRDGRGSGDAQARQESRGPGPSGQARETSVAPTAPRRAAARSLLDLYA